jgi:hypothetical protein
MAGIEPAIFPECDIPKMPASSAGMMRRLKRWRAYFAQRGSPGSIILRGSLMSCRLRIASSIARGM